MLSRLVPSSVGRIRLRRLVTLSLSVFLVLVLPACWYGAMTRAAILGVQAPSAANSNEEREDHKGHEEVHAVAGSTRTPPPDAVPPASTRVVVFTHVHAPTRVLAGALAPHPSRFSVRRLI